MTRHTSMDPAMDSGKVVDRGTDGLAMFAPPAEEPAVVVEEPEPLPPRADKRAKAMRITDAKMRRWIDAGRPVALEVARAKGKVTAALFREEAELRKVLPPTTGEDRTLSYIPHIFAELVAEGYLEKQRHPNGDPVREYDPETRNEHNVYVPTSRAA